MILAGRECVFLPQRAAFDIERRTLFVADVHLGKATAFAALGVPIGPQAAVGPTLADAQRLVHVVAETRAVELVILGDLLHAPQSRDHATLTALEQASAAIHQHGCTITLVRGNHDARAGDPPASCNIRCVPEGTVHRGLVLRHHPAPGGPVPGEISLCGHVHPVVRIGRGPGATRASCFWWKPARRGADGDGGQLMLPAFGTFTGGAIIEPDADGVNGQNSGGDRVWMVGPDAVVEVTRAMIAMGRQRGAGGRRRLR